MEINGTEMPDAASLAHWFLGGGRELPGDAAPSDALERRWPNASEDERTLIAEAVLRVLESDDRWARANALHFAAWRTHPKLSAGLKALLLPEPAAWLDEEDPSNPGHLFGHRALAAVGSSLALSDPEIEAQMIALGARYGSREDNVRYLVDAYPEDRGFVALRDYLQRPQQVRVTLDPIFGRFLGGVYGGRARSRIDDVAALLGDQPERVRADFVDEACASRRDDALRDRLRRRLALG